MKKKLLSCILAGVLALAYVTPCYAATEYVIIQPAATVAEAYCQYYDIDYDKSAETDEEIADMIKERGFSTVISGSIRSAFMTSTSAKKQRYIPDSYIADIIWTNNPVTPWNHVGLYTSSDKITEALSGGVQTRSTGTQKEYAFTIYKVMKADKSGRYSKASRKSVSSWALDNVGKKYDYNFACNKKNTDAGNSKFNCSELVWKAWRFNGTVSPDLDSNGGKGVYPNNIKNSDRTVKVNEG